MVLILRIQSKGTAVPCVTSRALEALEENNVKAEPGVYTEDIQVLANVLAMVFIGNVIF